jgi:hypothetical protein
MRTTSQRRQAGLHEPVPARGLLTGESGNGATGEAYFIKGEPGSPLNMSRMDAGALLFLAGKSPLAQLSERHFSAHRLAVGLA